MIKEGTIVIVEDDTDDIELLEKIIRELEINNEIKCFDNTEEAYTYLAKTNDKIFIIFCDIEFPKKSGLQFKEKIDDTPHLREKSIPFIFYSTWTKEKDVKEAYSKELSVQGFFKKGNDYKEVKEQIKMILDYWDDSVHPDT